MANIVGLDVEQVEQLSRDLKTQACGDPVGHQCGRQTDLAHARHLEGPRRRSVRRLVA